MVAKLCRSKNNNTNNKSHLSPELQWYREIWTCQLESSIAYVVFNSYKIKVRLPLNDDHWQTHRPTDRIKGRHTDVHAVCSISRPAKRMRHNKWGQAWTKLIRLLQIDYINVQKYMFVMDCSEDLCNSFLQRSKSYLSIQSTYMYIHIS